ncbi:uncharacterized protein DS421_20g704810 [Arachis hypogaea]|nr:uncharacterized protein DS421_20g704810 [Arachis hypogaea]
MLELLKPLPGSSGINKSRGSFEPSTIGVRNMLASEQECGSLHRDHIAEQKVLAKGSNSYYEKVRVSSSSSAVPLLPPPPPPSMSSDEDYDDDEDEDDTKDYS